MAKQGYRRYGYKSDVGMISKSEQLKNYLDEKFANVSVDTDVITNTINTAIDESMDCQFRGVNCHIENAKNEIINNLSCSANPCAATKQDIADAVTQINSHTDEKFNEVDFLKQFQDINEQIKNLKQ